MLSDYYVDCVFCLARLGGANLRSQFVAVLAPLNELRDTPEFGQLTHEHHDAAHWPSTPQREDMDFHPALPPVQFFPREQFWLNEFHVSKVARRCASLAPGDFSSACRSSLRVLT
jgi:hypothetical protein